MQTLTPEERAELSHNYFVYPVLDGYVDTTMQVWWRSAEGPQLVKVLDGAHRQNLQSFPSLYSVHKPAYITKVIYVYED